MPTQTDYDSDHKQDGPQDAISKDEQRRTSAAADRAHIDQLERHYNMPSAKEPDYGSPEGLAQAEQEGGDPNTVGNGFRENGSNEQSASSSAPAASGRLGGIQQKLKGLVNRRRALIGGGIISFLALMLLLSSGFSAFELINLRENALDHGNRFGNRVLQNRRAKTFGNMLKHMSDESVPEADRTKLKDSFKKQGFKVDFDKDGKLKEFSFTDKDGKPQKFNLDAADSVKETNRFFGNKDFGLAASKAFDKVSATRAGLWRGPAVQTKVYSAYKFIFFNWLDAKPSDKAKTPRAKFADVFRKSNATEQALAAQGAKTKQELGEGETTDKDGNKVSTSVTDAADVLNGELNNGISPEEYQAQMLADPNKTDSILGTGSNGDVDDYVNNTNKALNTGGVKTPEQLAGMGKGLLKGSAAAVFKSFNIIGGLQDACALKGILQFVTNYRNMVMSIELARFAIRILNAADDQKAGIVSSEGINLLMIYMTTPNPNNGKGHTASGGERWLKGDEEGRPSRANVSRYGVGRNNDGILGRVNSFVSNFPGMDHCNVVNNGFVTVGGFAVGIVASIGTGGAETAANLATMLTLAALHEVVIQVATPILIKAGAHMIGNGYEDGEQAGDMFSSGMGSLLMMANGSNGLRPSTHKQLAALEPDVNRYERSVAADQSIFERYLSPSNNDSLATHVAMAMPSSFHAASISFSSGLTSMLHSLSSFSFITYLLPGHNKAMALADSGCTDPQVKALGIATDGFCNVVMANAPDLDTDETKKILTANQQVDADGNPTTTKVGDGDDSKSFQEYLDLCASGRPGILYNPHPDQEGNSKTNDDTCVTPGAPLPGDSVGRYDRFAAWYGFRNDQKTIRKQLHLTTLKGDEDAAPTADFTETIQ